jgi:hypothetical protein
MRFIISLNEQEMEHITFQINAGSKSGQICFWLNERRFIELIGRALDWKDQQILIAKSKKMEAQKK